MNIPNAFIYKLYVSIIILRVYNVDYKAYATKEIQVRRIKNKCK